MPVRCCTTFLAVVLVEEVREPRGLGSSVQMGHNGFVSVVIVEREREFGGN